MFEELLRKLRDRHVQAHERLKHELAKLSVGRAHASMLDYVRVDYYGSPTPIPQVASVSAPTPWLIVVKPWEKVLVKAVDKAIREAGLGFNPQSDSEMVRVSIPPMTEERRKDLAKQAREVGERCNVAIREARREAREKIDAIVCEGKGSEDEGNAARKRVEVLTGEAIDRGEIFVDTKLADLFHLY